MLWFFFDSQLTKHFGECGLLLSFVRSVRFADCQIAIGNRAKAEAKQSIIEERLSMERPNRTLFVRNLDVRWLS